MTPFLFEDKYVERFSYLLSVPSRFFVFANIEGFYDIESAYVMIFLGSISLLVFVIKESRNSLRLHRNEEEIIRL